jgi:hypothetical protein
LLAPLKLQIKFLFLQCLAKQFNEMNINIAKSRGWKNVDQDIFESDSNHEDSHNNTGTTLHSLFFFLFLLFLTVHYLYNLQSSFCLIILLHHILNELWGYRLPD